MGSPLKKDQQLLNTARTYLDFGVLFPKTKIDARKPLTDYQRRKIKANLNVVIEAAGGEKHLERDFVKLPRSKSREKFSKATALPAAFRGVLIPGGPKHNEKIKFQRGHLTFIRGETALRFTPLDARSDSRLERTIRANFKNLKRGAKYISFGTYSGEIKYCMGEPSRTSVKADDTDAVDLLTEKALYLYNKYSALADDGGKRTNGRTAAHPSKWGLGLWRE